MKKVENLWAGLGLALAGAALGFFLAASTISFGNGSPGGDREVALRPSSIDPSRLTELTLREQNRIRIFEEASRSVVFISVSALQKNIFSLDVTEIPRGNGTGVVWDEQGHIVTNYHVVQGANRAVVKLHSGKSYTAKLVGIHPQKDLAILKIDALESELHPIRTGNSSDLLVGQTVMAIGNPFGLDQTLTNGIVSALNREINSPVNTKIINVIQTNAAINPGNSGGPLLDSSGRMIGINTMILSPSHANAGIGFAVPVDIVKKLAPQIIEHGAVTKPYHPVLGVEIDNSSEDAKRVYRRYGVLPVIIKKVASRGGAELAGIEVGDILIEAAGQRLQSIEDLRVVLERYDAGDVIPVKYLRDNEVHEVKVRLDEEP